MAYAAAPRRLLPVIVFSQFAGTSLWFAVNAVMPDLQREWGLPAAAVAGLTSAVQLGFVAGTLVFALLMIADRHAPTRVFFACSVLGALANAAVLLAQGSLGMLLVLRFCVGFLLAGIYPVGMKIASLWYREGLGAALGVLIGALVLGTALPHGLRALAGDGTASLLPGWQPVILAVSLLAAAGGVATLLLVPGTPPSNARAISPRALGLIVSDPRLRASVFGYFGHMWELYAFIVLVPAIVATRFASSEVSAWSFHAIAAGALGCIAGGLVARRVGSGAVAWAQLATSALCCIVSPLMLTAPLPLFCAWLLLWGTTVSGDSPQFSSMTSRLAPPEVAGSVLTFSNCIGFAISIATIELFVHAATRWPLQQVLPWLAVGPVLGLWMCWPLVRRR